MDMDTNNIDSITLTNQPDIPLVDPVIDNDVISQTDLVVENKSEIYHLEQSCNITNDNIDTAAIQVIDTPDDSESVVESILLNETETLPIKHEEIRSFDEYLNTEQVTTAIDIDPEVNSESMLTEKIIDESAKQESIIESEEIQNHTVACSTVTEKTESINEQDKTVETESINEQDKTLETESINDQDKSLETVIDTESNIDLQNSIQSNFDGTHIKTLLDESHTDNKSQSANTVVGDSIANLKDSSPEFQEIIDKETNKKIVESTAVDERQEVLDNQHVVSQSSTTQDIVILENIKLDEGKQLQVIEKQIQALDNSEPEGLIQESLANKTIIESVNVTDDIVKQQIEENANTKNLDTIDNIANTAILESEIAENIAHNDSIEQQMSNIVQDEEHANIESSRTLSIVEAISRDFDETDSEDVDKPESVDDKTVEMTQDNVMVGVSISDQLQHGGTVTVTDTSGQIYYVQSVEDLIVVENDDLNTNLDQPETFEVTVLNEVEEPSQSTSNQPKTKEKPPIPSHILGRNIDNPVIDTFRNGKVPPKPRLGVKIPYKNLTSQIVSKDEIAKEIIERQKARYKQSGQTTREMLFANKLTQRLAKKIAPTTQTVSKTSVAVKKKVKSEPINNSDLLAILEGDSDDPEPKKVQEPSTSKPTMSDESNKIKNANSEVKAEQPPTSPLSKQNEIEIALKQLQELPVSTGRRRRGAASTTTLRDIRESEVVSKNKYTSNISDKTAPVAETKNNENETVTQIYKEKHSDTAQVELSQKPKEKESISAIKTQEKQKLEENVNIISNVVVDKVESTEKNSVPDVKQKANDTNQSLSIKEKSAETTPNLDVNEVTSTKPKQLEETKETNEPVKIKSNEVKQSVKETKNDLKKVDATTTQTPVSSKIVNKADPGATNVKEEFTERKLSNQPVKTYTRKRKSIEDMITTSDIPDKKPTVQQKDVHIPPNSYVTKSSRIIKRKVIWDPDEPSTARSLAGKSIKIEPKEKIVKPVDVISKKPIAKPVQKIEIIKTPVKSPDMKGKKRLSEVDKLLMDEGAVNMLYAFKNIDEATKKKKSSVISLDKAQKELMNKTNELKKDLRTNSDKISPKSLRKKDSPISSFKKVVPASISRKKSKDSNRSSLHSPPASPSMMYQNQAEASRIIRRHSSSSFSSMDGEFDAEKKETALEATPVETEKTSKRRNTPSSAENTKNKRPKKSTEKENITIPADKNKASDENSKDISKLTQGEEKKEIKYEKYKTFSVKEFEHMVQIILLPSFNNEAYLTPEILNDLCNVLKELEKDSNCTVVLISSSASAFCHGINYKTLISDKEQSRKTFAKKLATCVTNFLRILATFPKILVAGIHGDTVGLGVTILPLFDMVIASDTATFSIPNARLGCAAEGGSLLSLPHLMHNVLVSELLYASRKLIAAEALRLGMVTRVLWPDKFQQELVAIVKNISNYSPQFMELTKKQLRLHMLQDIEGILNKEIDILIQHWTSTECQKNFGVYG